MWPDLLQAKFKKETPKQNHMCSMLRSRLAFKCLLLNYVLAVHDGKRDIGISELISHASLLRDDDCTEVLNSDKCKLSLTQELAGAGNLLEVPIPLIQLALANLSRNADPQLLAQWSAWKGLGNYALCTSIDAHYCTISLFGLGGGIGQCLPKNCSAPDLMLLFSCQVRLLGNLTGNFISNISIGNEIRAASQAVGYQFTLSTSSCSDDLVTFSDAVWPGSPSAKGGAAATFLFASIVVAVVLLATFANQIRISWTTSMDINSDDTGRSSSEVSWPVQIIKDFDAVENCGHMLRTRPTKSGPSGVLDCLHGIRVISIGYIILGHTTLFLTTIVSNTVPAVENYVTSINVLVINGAFSAVDTFFWLSGFLTGTLVLKAQSQTRNIGKALVEWILALLHRYLRLGPAYFFALIIYINLGPYLGSGPLWAAYQQDESWETCKQKWWANVLYVNNIQSLTGLAGGCMGWTWYLALDMQYFVVSTLLLTFFRWAPKLVKSLCLLISVACMILVGTLTYSHNIGIVGVDVNYGKWLYFSTPCRMGPYFIAVLFGILWHEGWICPPGTRRGRYLLHIAGLLGLALVLMDMLLPWEEIHAGVLLNKPGNWSRWENTMFNACQRTFYVVGLCLLFSWVSLAEGRIPLLIRSTLSWQGFQVMAKLSYGAYLWHLTILQSSYTSTENYMTFSNMTIATEFFAIFAMAFLVSGASYLLVEKPCTNIEAHLMNSLKAATRSIPSRSDGHGRDALLSAHAQRPVAEEA